MRIIGGRLAGRQFRVPKKFTARPTTDLVKESLFNILGHQLDFVGIEVLDLFSGSGGIAFEFVSRGAEHVVAVENNYLNYKFILTQKEKFELEELETQKLNCKKFLKTDKRKFDVIFADPPYEQEGISDLVSEILDSDRLKEDGFLIIEHGSNTILAREEEAQEVRRYGQSRITIFRKN